MSLPIGFFAPLPLPMMIPFMGIQSAVMAEQFGTMFQYGKRRISAMSNEQFNELTFEKLQSEMTKQLEGMIPEMKKQIQAMQPLVEHIIHEFGNYLRLAGKEVLNIVESGITEPRGFNLTINQVEQLAKETNTTSLIQILIDLGILPATPTEGQIAAGSDLDPITSHNVPVPQIWPTATDPTSTYIPGSPSIITATTEPTLIDTAGISVGHEGTEGKMKFGVRFYNKGEAQQFINNLELQLSKWKNIMDQAIKQYADEIAKNGVGTGYANTLTLRIAEHQNLITVNTPILLKFRQIYREFYGEWY